MLVGMSALSPMPSDSKAPKRCFHRDGPIVVDTDGEQPVFRFDERPFQILKGEPLNLTVFFETSRRD